MTATWEEFERLELALGRVSEVLVLGALSEAHGVVLLRPDREVGSAVA